MRTALLAAALLAAAPLPALAGFPATVDLLAGQSYVLVADNNGLGGYPTVTLKDFSGHIVTSLIGWDDGNGVEFKATYTATYFLYSDQDQDNTNAAVYPDCPVTLATPCHLALNHTKMVSLSWRLDGDSFRVRLNAGRRYRFDVQGDEVVPTLLDLRGRKLATTLEIQGQGALLFRPRTTGDYVLRLQNTSYEQSHNVVVSLRLAQ